jgi:tripartite-type tricarboxylate transporter receptor subunit TctC
MNVNAIAVVRFVSAAASLALALTAPAHAQTGVVKLLVGYPPGGPVDTAARLVAPAFAKELGATVIVENKPGASGVIAGEAIVKAPPDGSALYFAASPTITIAPHVQKKMSFDPLKDLAPIGPVLSYANVLIVHKDLPYQSLSDLVKDAKAKPGSLTFASSGPGASNHLSGELFAVRSGTKLTHVPYKGNAPALQDLLGGQVTMMFDVISSANRYISTGTVRALAVTSPTRNPQLPNVPTMAEAGVPGVEVIGWFAVYGPPRTPEALINRYGQALAKAVQSDEVRSKLVAQGYEPWPGNAAALAEQQKKEFDTWATVARGIEIKE